MDEDFLPPAFASFFSSVSTISLFPHCAYAGQQRGIQAHMINAVISTTTAIHQRWPAGLPGAWATSSCAGSTLVPRTYDHISRPGAVW